MKHIFSLSSLPLAALLLASACGGDVKGDLGLRKDSPDEFRVISAPPLSVPPDFSLLPPASGAAPAASNVNQDNRHLLGQQSSPSGVAAPTPQVKASSLPSSGDSKFLSKAGAASIDPTIRDTIAKETQPLPQEEEKKGFFKKMLSLNKDEEAKVVVDAAAEKKRMTENKASNKPVTTGETPTIKEKKSVLQKIFGSESQ